MAKKKKRRVSHGVAHSGNQSSGNKVQASRSSGEFNPDYTAVIQDLKRIGIMAVSFISILIILSFVIN